MIALPTIDPPVLIAPAEIAPTEVRRKKRRRGRIPLSTLLVVGMIVTGDDGQPCRIVHVNPDGVTGYCVPLEQ